MEVGGRLDPARAIGVGVAAASFAIATTLRLSTTGACFVSVVFATAFAVACSVGRRRTEWYVATIVAAACFAYVAFETSGGRKALRGNRWTFEEGDVDAIVRGPNPERALVAFADVGTYAEALGDNVTLAEALRAPKRFGAWTLVVPSSLTELPPGFAKHVEDAIDANARADVVWLGGAHDPVSVAAFRRKYRPNEVLDWFAECGSRLVCVKVDAFA